MTTPLLTTKLHVPRLRAEMVPRPRLMERLDAGLDRKLTLVSAPAGFGKTTLLGEWVRRCPRPVAWVSLDESDNTPARFLACFVAALQTIETRQESIGSGGPGLLSALRGPQPPPIESLLAALINEITAVPDRFALVLDDYHAIEAPSIHGALTFLLDHLPPPMHVVIATRTDPPLPLARLRARGQLTELRQAELRFTPDEAGQFLRRVTGLDLPADDVGALASRTEGWIAGLQMAALSLQGAASTQGAEGVERFVRAFTGSNRYVIDYLTEEVLQRQPEHIRAFLLQTAILDRMTGPLCDAVVRGGESANERMNEWANERGGESAGQRVSDLPICRFADLPFAVSSQEVLEYLERQNLFVVPLDDERRWYRYHRLFRDLLRQRLQQAQADLVPTLHRRASRWYEENGPVSVAVDHALAAGDFERAAGLIDELADALWGRGEQAPLRRWLDALPDEQARARPRLSIFHALLLFAAGQTGAAERRLQTAKQALDAAAGRGTAELRGRLAAARAYVAFTRGELPAIVRFSRQALEHLPDQDLTWRSIATYTLGLAQRLSGDLEAANQALAEAVRVSARAGNTYVNLLARLNLARLQTQQGHLRRAAEILQRALDLAGEEGMLGLPVAGMLSAELGGILVEWNELDEALDLLEKSAALIERGQDVTALEMTYAFTARGLYARGAVDGAMDVIHEMEHIADRADVSAWIRHWSAGLKLQIHVARGDLAAAAQLAQELGLDEGDDPTYRREMAYTPFVRLLIAQGRPEATMGLLERLLQSAQAEGRLGRAITTLALRALALQAQGELDRALADLERALSIAEPEGYVRVFVDEGPAMAKLLRHAATRGVAPEYASKLLAAFEGLETGTHPRVQPLIEPLSQRELEVLRRLATDLTLEEIAQEFFIARSTVRSHTKHIYGKLNVHSRREAVRRARELGLL